MNNEEFQKIVLEKLGGLEEGMSRLENRQSKLEERQGNLEKGQLKLEDRQSNLEEGQEDIKRSLQGAIDQIYGLTEFKYQTEKSLEEINSKISRIEINTADNWSDIAKLKSIK